MTVIPKDCDHTLINYEHYQVKLLIVRKGARNSDDPVFNRNRTATYR